MIRSRQNISASIQPEGEEKTAHQGRSKRDTEFMHKLETIIKENLDNPSLNIDQLAERMFMSRTTLYAKLKEVAATTPNKYILDIRMVSALEIIKSDKDIQVNELADRVGFHTPSYFINQFKTHYGVTPNEFRKSFFNLD